MDQLKNDNYRVWLYIMIGMAVLVNFSALFVTIIGPDGTYYAGIAKTMVLRHNYVELFVQGRDFLDKPHFPFWVTALFFEVFGFRTFAYKLPGILFLMTGAWYTWKFAKALYNEEIALWSVLILLTAEHIIISNNDVRAEPYLTGMIIASVYHFYQANLKNNYRQLLAGCLFAAMAIMTKGMFAIIPIAGAMGGQLLITRQWKQVFHWRWLLAIVLTLIFILPEIYCLYVQFDIHPEKLVFERRNVSGIKFFFWDSQFGRFFNTGPFKGSGDPFFFVHTLLWAFLPWSLLLFVSIFRFFKTTYKNVQSQQWYCICGSMITFLVFSASKFQLPYYLNIVFPFFAIILANYLYELKAEKKIKAVNATQKTIIVILLIIIGILQYFFRPVAFSRMTGIAMAVMFILMLFLPIGFGVDQRRKAIIRTVFAAFIVNFYLSLAFYPSLLHYQSGSEAAFWINKNNPQHLTVAQTGDNYSFPLEFYLKQPLITIDPNGHGPVPAKPFYLFGDAGVIKNLQAQGWHIEPVKSFDMYWISMLKPAFLNRNTRGKAITVNEVVIVR